MPRLPKNRLIMAGVDASEGPVFTVSEVAKIFFARTPHWVRWKDNEGAFNLNGEYVGGFRIPAARGREGARRYTLADIEKMTHALAQNGSINGYQMMHSLMVIKAIAEVHELFNGEDEG